MKDGIMLTIGADGKAAVYDDTYDIVIHCESQEEQNQAMKRLENIPRWIPCSEGLPGVNGSYLVTVHPNYIVPGCIHVDMLSWFNGKWWFDLDGQDAEFPDPIIAWMPLPDPYGGEDNAT